MSPRLFANAVAALCGAMFLGLAAVGPVSASELQTAVEGADASAGEGVFRRCLACHSNTAGGGNRVGPGLWGIVGRQVGSVDGFRYSAAMTGSEDVWTLESLNAYLENPRAAFPGTSMGFPGVRSETERLNLLAYLQTLKDQTE